MRGDPDFALTGALVTALTTYAQFWFLSVPLLVLGMTKFKFEAKMSAAIAIGALLAVHTVYTAWSIGSWREHAVAAWAIVIGAVIVMAVGHGCRSLFFNDPKAQ
jgi:succinate-acetate transporter protein